MVNVVSASSPIHYRVVVRSNSVLRAGRENRIFWLILPLGGLATLGVFLFGAGPVLPVSAVVGICVAWACDHCLEHRSDFERMTLAGSRLVIERRDGEQVERHEMNGLWAQVVIRETPDGGSDYLAVRCKGEELPFGRNLTSRERAQIGRELRSLLIRLRT